MAQFWKGFMLFALIMICAGAVIGILFGHPIKLPKGFDSDSIACGVDAGVEDYPYTYFVNPTPEYKYRTVCVKTCPNAETKELDCVPNRVVQDCKKQMNVLYPDKVVLYYDSFGYMGNVCVPTSLQYYAGIQDLVVPNMFKRIVNDFTQSWPLICIVGLLSLSICYTMMTQLKENTTYLVWTFTIITILLIGFLGAHFVQQWNFARNYETHQEVINNLKVTAEYIYEMTNRPNELINFVLAIIFLCAFIYGVIWLYQKTEVVQDLADMFEYVEDFMKIYSPLTILSLYFILLFLILFSLIVLSTIFLGSAFSIDRESKSGPFEKTQLNIIFSFSTIAIIIFGIWVIQIINGTYQSVIFGAFRDWIHSKIYFQNIQIQQVQDQANQIDPINQAKINLKLIYQNLNQNMICQISFLLLFSPIKFILDYIKDQLQKIFKCHANPIKSIAVIEEVLYFEVQSNSKTISDPINALRKSLNIESDGKELNAFEIVRNINDFFLIIVKLFTFLICGVMFLSLYKSTTILAEHVQFLQPLLKMNIYQPLIPAAICGTIGYFIAQIYFCQYTIVQCFGYFYLSIYTKVEEQYQEKIRQNNQQYLNNQREFILQFQQQNQSAKQLKLLNENFHELEEMMNRALKNDENNQDDQNQNNNLNQNNQNLVENSNRVQNNAQNNAQNQNNIQVAYNAQNQNNNQVQVQNSANNNQVQARVQNQAQNVVN